MITDYRLSPPTWPKGRRLTVTVIADLHAGGPNMGVGRVRQVVDTGNALGSDLIVVLGDYFATHPFVTERVPPPAWAAELARLRAPLGVYAILGNHDWWYDIDGVRNALRTVGMPLLQNSIVHIASPDQRFWLAGLDDQLAHWLGPRRVRGASRHARAHHRRRSRYPARARARYFHRNACARRAHHRRPHTWRPGARTLRAAGLGAVGLWRALRLRPYRRGRPSYDRLRRPRMQQGAVASRCSSGDCTDHIGLAVVADVVPAPG